MLSHIHIEHFTIVDTLSIDFDSGLSILTGETGAGKSIWVDAISLAFGARADTRFIRHGKERCSITLSFDLSELPTARQWLKSQDLDDDNHCIIKKVIKLKGNSRSEINGKPCTIQMVKTLSGLLLNIHSQHEHQSLLKPHIQQEKLDFFANATDCLTQLNEIVKEWKQLKEKLNDLTTQSANKNHELEYCQYQAEELRALDLEANEWQTLSEEHQSLHHLSDNQAVLQDTLQMLSENEDRAALGLLQQSISRLSHSQGKSNELSQIQSNLETIALQLEEASQALSTYVNQIELDPNRLTTLESRLSQIYELSRKHHVKPEALNDVLDRLESRITDLENIDREIERIQASLNALETDYHKVAATLTNKRTLAAKELNNAITNSMESLNIIGGEFEVALNPRSGDLHHLGAENIEFLVRTNVGQDFGALSKVASGGELSRISLAIQVLMGKKNTLPTMIFDEVDTGISGKTAEIVGKLLNTLSRNNQVLCITHLPQVAAQADHHYKVSKHTSNNQTFTKIERLDDEDRVEELARLLSGEKVTEEILNHSRQLLSQRDELIQS